MRSSFVIVLLLGFFAVPPGWAAGPLDLAAGYDKSRWGSSVEETKAAYPEMQETAPQPMAEPGALPSPNPVLRYFAVSAAEPLRKLRFTFLDGHLYQVTAVLSRGVAAKVDSAEVAKAVWAKYFVDPNVHQKLSENGISITVPGGVFRPVRRVGEPTDAAEGYSSIMVGNLDDDGMTVQYSNQTVATQTTEKAKERRRKALEQNAAELKLGETL